MIIIVPFSYQLQSSFWPSSGLCLKSSFKGSSVSGRTERFIIVIVTICLLMLVCLTDPFPSYFLSAFYWRDYNHKKIWIRCSCTSYPFTEETQLSLMRHYYIIKSLINLFSLLRWWNAGVLHWPPDSVVSQGKEDSLLIAGLLSGSSPRSHSCKHQNYLMSRSLRAMLVAQLPDSVQYPLGHWFLSSPS